MTMMSQKMKLSLRPPDISGLYVITPNLADTSLLMRQVRQALLGGSQVVQYRNKLASPALRLQQALALHTLTTEFSVPLIINDEVELAAQVGAEGVHLGRADGSLAAARRVLGKDKIIGITAYNQPLLAQQAELGGADYVAFGAFYPSPSKPDASPVSVDLLRQMRAEMGLPLVAIGGITQHNAAPLLAAGAAAVAVISAVFNALDIRFAAQQFSNLFKKDAP
jgi:thiamine-phosphate pyrophosphorylase